MTTLHYKRLLFYVINFAVLFGSVIVLSSCESTFFNSPQPVDADNIYQFPKEFRGSWIVDEEDTITMTSDYYRQTTGGRPTKIINGLYVNPSDTIPFVKGDSLAWKRRLDMSRPFASMRSIKFDSLKNPIDTTTNYVIKGNMIYPIEADGLGEGSTFYIEHDTIYRKITMSSIEFELGRNAFLRKVADHRYLVNLRAELFGSANKGWWVIYLLEKTPEKKILIQAIDQDKMNTSELVYQKGDDLYFDSRWTKQDVQRHIQEGLFKPQDEPLDDKHKIKKR